MSNANAPKNDPTDQTVRAADPASGGDAQPPKDEPELQQEESVPSDGKDHEGERMMEQLGQERREKAGQ